MRLPCLRMCISPACECAGRRSRRWASACTAARTRPTSGSASQVSGWLTLHSRALRLCTREMARLWGLVAGGALHWVLGSGLAAPVSSTGDSPTGLPMLHPRRPQPGPEGAFVWGVRCLFHIKVCSQQAHLHFPALRWPQGPGLSRPCLLKGLVIHALRARPQREPPPLAGPEVVAHNTRTSP
jgi:hypothetical protein